MKETVNSKDELFDLEILDVHKNIGKLIPYTEISVKNTSKINRKERGTRLPNYRKKERYIIDPNQNGKSIPLRNIIYKKNRKEKPYFVR